MKVKPENEISCNSTLISVIAVYSMLDIFTSVCGGVGSPYCQFTL